MTRIASIEGKIMLEDGREHVFIITTDGRSSWGADAATLGETSAILDDWTESLREDGDLVDDE